MKVFILKRKSDGLFLDFGGQSYLKIKSGDHISNVSRYSEKDVTDYAQRWGSIFEFVKIEMDRNGYWILP